MPCFKQFNCYIICDMAYLNNSCDTLKPAVLSREATAKIRKAFTALVSVALLGTVLFAASVAISNPAGAVITFTAPSRLSVAPGGTITVDASAYATESGHTITCADATGSGAIFTAASFTRTGCSYRITAGTSTGTLTFIVPYTSTSTDTHDGSVSITVGDPPTLSSSGCTDNTFVETLTDPPLSGSNNDLQEDCQALVSFKNIFAASNAWSEDHVAPPFMRTWGTGTPSQQKIRNWEGVTVASATFVSEGSTQTRARVTALQVGNTNGMYGLSGSVPSAIVNLTQLTILDLNGYTLLGSIPASLGSLTTLTSIDLSSNRFTGSIPTQLGSLTNLISLDLSDNQLTNSVPTQLGTITSLTTLGICNNFLTGALPVALQSGVTLTGYPTTSGYDPIQCQNPNNIQFTPQQISVEQGKSIDVDASLYASQGSLIISCADATLVDPKITIISRNGCRYVVMALSDSEGGASFTVPYSSSSSATRDGRIPVSITLPTLQSILPPDFSLGLPPPPPAEAPKESYLRWNFFSTQEGGAIPAEISLSLAASAYPDIWTWDVAEQRWSRVTSMPALPAGALVAFRSYLTPDADELDAVNLGTTSSATISQGWNILSIPDSLTRPKAETFLFEERLLDCGSQARAVVIANYNTRENAWHLWLPCHPDAEAFYTEGAITPSLASRYNALSSITETHPVYLFFASPAPVDILWDGDAYEVQDALSACPPLFC